MSTSWPYDSTATSESTSVSTAPMKKSARTPYYSFIRTIRPGISENECFRRWSRVLTYRARWLNMTWGRGLRLGSMTLRIWRRRIRCCLRSQSLGRRIILSCSWFLILRSSLSVRCVRLIIRKIVNLIWRRFEESRLRILIFWICLVRDTSRKSEFSFPKTLIRSIWIR